MAAEGAPTTTAIGAHPKIRDDAAGQELRRALHRFDRGELDQAALDQVLDATTARAVHEMDEAGVDVLTHGQVRWDDAFAPFVRAWRNVSREALERYFDNNTYFRTPTVGGEIVVAAEATVREYEVARAATARRVKGAVCGPLTFARLADDRHYGDRGRLAVAVATALREEVLALERAGCDLIDVEEPALARWPEDLAHAADAYAALSRGIRADLALHLTMFPADPLVDRLAALPFAQFGLDLCSRPTRALERIDELPGTVVLGVVDARNTRLETAEEIARLLEAATRKVESERIWLAPTTSLEYLPHDVALAKLGALVAGARLAPAAGGAR